MADALTNTVLRGCGLAASAKITGPATDIRPSTANPAAGPSFLPANHAQVTEKLDRMTDDAWAASIHNPEFRNSASTPWHWNARRHGYVRMVYRMSTEYSSSAALSGVTWDRLSVGTAIYVCNQTSEYQRSWETARLANCLGRLRPPKDEAKIVRDIARYNKKHRTARRSRSREEKRSNVANHALPAT